MLWGTTYGFTGQCFLYQQYTYYVMRDDLWFYRTMFPISTIHVLCYEGRLMVLQDNVSYINNTRIMLWGTTYGFTGQCFLYQQYTYYVMRDDLWFYRTMFPISTIHVLCYEGRLMVLQDNVSYINNTRIMLWGTTYGFTGQCFLYQQYTYYVMRDDLWFYRTMFPISTIHVLCYEGRLMVLQDNVSYINNTRIMLWGTTYGFTGQCFLYQQYTYYVMRDDLWFYRTMFPISTIHVLCYEGRLMVLQDNVSYINNTRSMLWGTTYGFTGQCFLYQQYTYYVMRDDLWFYRTMFPISTIHVLCYEGRLMVLQDNVSYINNTRIMLWRTTYGFTGQCFLYQQYTYHVMRDDLWFYKTMFPISTIHVLCYEEWLMVLQDNVSYINNIRSMLRDTTCGFTGQCFLYQQYTYYVMRDDLWFYRTMFPISTIHVVCYEGRLLVLQDNVLYINNTRIMLWGTTYGFTEQCFLYQQYTYYVMRDDLWFYRTMFPISTIHVLCYEGRLMVLQENVSYINNTRIMLWGTTYGFTGQCFLYQQYT